MKNIPFLVPEVKVTKKSLSTLSSYRRLMNSFVPADGRNQVGAGLDREARYAVLDPENTYMTYQRRLDLLFKFSVHPRESLRDWAEESLYRITTDDHRLALPLDEDISLFFPWDQEECCFEFTLRRAVVLVRRVRIDSEMACFLVHYPHEEISAKLLKFIESSIQYPQKKSLSGNLDEVLMQILKKHMPNARRMIAKSRHLCWRVFDQLVEDGLPLHTMDAIEHVIWNLYVENVSTEVRKQTETRIKRMMQCNPQLRRTVKGGASRF